MLFYAGVADAKFYKWVDEQGNTHYTATPPPESLVREREAVSRQGITLEKAPGRMTAEENVPQQQQHRSQKNGLAMMSPEELKDAFPSILLGGEYVWMSPEELKGEGSVSLCQAYSEWNARAHFCSDSDVASMRPCHVYSGGITSVLEKIKEELILRGEMSHVEWELIGRRKFDIGMSILALTCSLGVPRKTNESVGSWGRLEQWIYGSTYIRIKNAEIESWRTFGR